MGGAPTAAALARVVAENSWASLPTTKKIHHMRPEIDRRFCRTPESRTRTYHLYDDYDEDDDSDGFGLLFRLLQAASH